MQLMGEIVKALKGLFRVVIGAIFGIVAGVALLPAFAALFPPKDGSFTGAALTLAVVVIGAILGLFAPTIRRAFGRGFLLAGVCFLALPISALLLSGRSAHEAVTTSGQSDQAAAALGAGLAGVAVTGVAAVIGLFVGGIFVIIGLVLALGGRREVVIVERK